MKLFARLASILFVFCLLQLAASAAPYTVANTQDAGAGSLRQAILDAENNPGVDVINIAAIGTVLLQSSLPTVTQSLTINGGSQTGFIVSGQNTVRVFQVDASGDLQLSGLTVRNGRASGSGGRGGGIRNLGTLTINNSTITASTSDQDGGGIANFGTLTINNSTVGNNTAFSAGGIFNVNTLTINNSTLSGNTATGGIGGGIGGGILNGGDVTINNSTFSANDAYLGGGIYNATGTLTLSNGTVTRNIADEGGGVYNENGLASVGNSIIAENGFPPTYSNNVSGNFISRGYNFIDLRNDSTGFGVNGDLVDTNSFSRLSPGLDSLRDNGGPTQTHAPFPYSLVIDKGKNLAVDASNNPVTTDQRGQMRTADQNDAAHPNASGGDGTDIGAVEYQAANNAPTASAAPNPATTDEDTSVQITLIGTDADDNNLTFAVTDAPDFGMLSSISTPDCSAVNVCTATVNFAPNANYNGADSFQFKANDGAADSSIVTVQVTVSPINDAPVANNDSYTTTRNSGALNVAAQGVLSNDTDAEDNNLTAVLVSNPANGSLTLNADGSFSYTPNQNFSGTDSFSYSASDGALNSNPATVTITVSAGANISLVVTKTADTDDGKCDADCSLREAIAVAAPGDTITFNIPASDAGCVSGACAIELARGTLTINKSLNIMGTGANLLTVKRSPNASPFRIFAVLRNTNVNISGLTVSGGGDGDQFGGSGVINVGNLNLINVVISGNSTNADWGGGGIRNSGALVLYNSTVSDNHGKYGGAVYNSSGTVTIINSTLSGNTGTTGAGIYNNAGTINVVNSTVSGNISSFDCGAIYAENSNSSVTLTNATVTKNASQGTGGICNNGSTVNLRNTIVADNSSATGTPDVNGNITSQGYNLIGNASGGIVTTATGDQIGTQQNPIDPKLDALGDKGGTTKTHALLAGSPAINKGGNVLATDQNGSALTTDQRGAGFTRKSGANVDIGAFELQLPPTAAAVSVNGRVLTVLGRGISGATVTLTDADGNTRTARANSFGYYRFEAVAAGATYVLQARHKRFAFAPQVLSVAAEMNNLNFTATQ